MNSLQCQPEHMPLLIGHLAGHRVSAGDKRVENQTGSIAGAPERGRSRFQRSKYIPDPALGQCPGDEEFGLVDRSESDLEEIIRSVLGADSVDGSIEIVAEGKKLDRAHAQVVLGIETGGYRAEVQTRVIPHAARDCRRDVRLATLRSGHLPQSPPTLLSDRERRTGRVRKVSRLVVTEGRYVRIRHHNASVSPTARKMTRGLPPVASPAMRG